MCRIWCGFLLLVILVCGIPEPCSAYSVLTHEEIIDLAWNGSIRPLLLSRYPGTTEEQLQRAHAFAYGGCAIQDAGYYPFANVFFSDLAHYVRTGDFVDSLFRNAHNVDEYAFAIGAMSHYVGDSIGHADAINPATAIEYPRLAKKFGSVVTYQNSPHAFVATEFSFDVEQISRDRFAPDAYLHYIGLKVPRKLLERAFFETYGLKLTTVMGKTSRAGIRSYRGSVRSFIPVFAKSEVVIHRKNFPEDVSTDSFTELEHELEQAAYLPAWEHEYRRPNFGEHLLAIVIRILPPIGPIAYLKIRGPNTKTEQLYVDSLVRTMSYYDNTLNRLTSHPETPLRLPNLDLDTGQPTRRGAYALTDKTYSRLLHIITSDPQRRVPAGLRRDILKFYADPGPPVDAKGGEQILRELDTLKQMNSIPEP